MEGTFCGAVISQRLENSSVKPTDLCSVNLGEGPDSHSLTDCLNRAGGENRMRNLMG